MKAKKMTAAVAVALGLAATGATASPMYLDLAAVDGTPNVFEHPLNSPGDADSQTGVFNEFGFSALLATSIYDTASDGTIFGAFTDTNRPALLAAAGVPTAGLALDGVTPVSLVTPTGAQSDLDALNPLVPPLASDSEGFLLTWDLKVLYDFSGTLSPTGPTYTSGTFEILFDDFNNNANDQVVVTGTLTSSQVVGVGLILNFDVTSALDNFLYVDDGTGTFIDAADGNGVQLRLDTNVDPAVPTANQLLQVGPNAIRQGNLDGSVTGLIPAPGVIALMGLGLLGMGAARRRKA